MRLMICAVAALFSAAPAYAYHCDIQQNGSAIKTCANTTAAQPCEANFSGTNLKGVCGVQTQGTTDILICAITTQTASATSVLQAGASAAAGNPGDGLKALAQLPGFVGGGITIAQQGKGIVGGVVKEQASAPTLAGTCTP